MVTETKFTPGPWHVVERYGYLSVQQALTPILRLSPVGDYEQTEANAHLIAAAPELYAALERFFSPEYRPDMIDGYDFMCETERIARAALAKARGEA